MTQYLMCPLCGSHNLHHKGLIDFTRPKGEDTPIRVTSISKNRVNITDDAAIVAVTRRGWMRIFFECEECDADQENLYLEISQYKGETRMSWGIMAGDLTKKIELQDHDLA